MKETIIPDWVPEIERFSLEGLLGNGNWKGVVKGKLLSDDSLWALKFLNMTPLAEELMASRGQTEEEVLRKETMGGNIPHHQNIAYGFIDHADDGTPFLAERYIPGRSLTDSLSGITTFGQSEIHHVASQLATCLNVYHSKMGGQGMAHGDFKPANMIYTPDQTVVLFDNGCATMAAQQVVGDTGIPVEQIKDMEYILTRPPEWFELRKPDKKTDLWSFGSILYKLFTREYFFEEEFKERKDPYDLMKYLSDNPEIAKATLEQKLQHPSIPKQFKPLFRQVMSPWEERMENATLLPNRVDDAVKKYIRANRFTLGQKISVAVVIQKMINSDVSGVAFSVHPVTKKYNEILIEACFGLGEAIVSGQVTPDSYVIEKNDWLIQNIVLAEQKQALIRQKNGGNLWSPIKNIYIQKIGGKRIVELAQLIGKIEDHYGFPCDIEWAMEGGEFFITQSRPITTLK